MLITASEGPSASTPSRNHRVQSQKSGWRRPLHSTRASTALIGGQGDQTRPIYAGNGVVYFTSERGDGHWDIAVSSGPGKKKVIARTRLPVRASPALAGGGQWVAFWSDPLEKGNSSSSPSWTVDDHRHRYWPYGRRRTGHHIRQRSHLHGVHRAARCWCGLATAAHRRHLGQGHLSPFVHTL